MQSSIEIVEERVRQVCVICPQGRIDTRGAPELEERLGSILDGGETRLVVDLSAAEYVSSAGLRVFLSLVRKLEGVDGELVLCSLNELVQEAFDIAGFTDWFHIQPSRQGAVRSLAPTDSLVDMAARLLAAEPPGDWPAPARVGPEASSEPWSAGPVAAVPASRWSELASRVARGTAFAWSRLRTAVLHLTRRVHDLVSPLIRKGVQRLAGSRRGSGRPPADDPPEDA